LNGGQAYIKGTWASTLQYRKSNKTFYWLGCIEFSKTYVYTATGVVERQPSTMHTSEQTISSAKRPR